MKSVGVWIGVISICICLVHGFFTGQSIVHSLVLHPIVLLASLSLLAFSYRKRTVGNSGSKHQEGYCERAKPFVQTKLNQANAAREKGDVKAEFKHLEDAHVIGQRSTHLHTLVHWQMLVFGVRYRILNEVIGQSVRILGAITKTAVGLLPHGNTGGSNVSAFKSMPISEQNQIVLAKINAKK
ncbi:DUF3703 domain-containing protein [Alteromonas stellipolaris]|jgi:hypothetical protein|uniref:DUF3703 domain-containing protein n=1 Tax=Alteromonas stellipolaris TaxID=233316 RepID=UPI00349FBAE3